MLQVRLYRLLLSVKFIIFRSWKNKGKLLYQNILFVLNH
jgi:hypothetical protein